MKKCWIGCMLLILIFASCVPQMQTEQPAIPNNDLNPTRAPVILAGSEQAFDSINEIVINQLATNLGLAESDISVISNSDVEFEDSCMGVPMKDVKCAQVVVSGKIIILETDGVQYEYHVRGNGAVVQPATLALVWTRDGGIAGFCDNLTVFLSGEVYGNRCNSEPDRTMGTFANLLSKDERKQLNAWIKELGQVDLDASNPEGVSDRMEVTLSFYGSGQAVLGKSDEQEILLWIQNLFQKLVLSQSK